MAGRRKLTGSRLSLSEPEGRKRHDDEHRSRYCAAGDQSMTGNQSMAEKFCMTENQVMEQVHSREPVFDEAAFHWTPVLNGELVYDWKSIYAREPVYDQALVHD